MTKCQMIWELLSDCSGHWCERWNWRLRATGRKDKTSTNLMT